MDVSDSPGECAGEVGTRAFAARSDRREVDEVHDLVELRLRQVLLCLDTDEIDQPRRRTVHVCPEHLARTDAEAVENAAIIGFAAARSPFRPGAIGAWSTPVGELCDERV